LTSPERQLGSVRKGDVAEGVWETCLSAGQHPGACIQDARSGSVENFLGDTVIGLRFAQQGLRRGIRVSELLVCTLHNARKGLSRTVQQARTRGEERAALGRHSAWILQGSREG
jgi:hypothetical protein